MNHRSASRRAEERPPAPAVGHAWRPLQELTPTELQYDLGDLHLINPEQLLIGSQPTGTAWTNQQTVVRDGWALPDVQCGGRCTRYYSDPDCPRPGSSVAPTGRQQPENLPFARNSGTPDRIRQQGYRCGNDSCNRDHGIS